MRGVIFDLDGTLADSLRDIAEAANEVLEARGWPSFPLSVYRRAVGEGVHRLLERLAERLPEEVARLDGEDVERLVRDFRARYEARMLRHTRPFDGVEALLSALAEREVPVAVLSNKPHEATLRVVQALFPGYGFRVVLGRRPEVPRKPDPAGAFEAAGALGLPPDDVVFVGDTPVDVHTARAAGMVPVGVAWGFREPEELRSAGAAAILGHPGDLLDWLRGES